MDTGNILHGPSSMLPPPVSHGPSLGRRMCQSRIMGQGVLTLPAALLTCHIPSTLLRYQQKKHKTYKKKKGQLSTSKAKSAANLDLLAYSRVDLPFIGDFLLTPLRNSL